jgi:ubiquinone/menaquinone biosynthesis C-methylase UbiE
MKNEEYSSYIQNSFRIWSKFYDLTNIFISGIRKTTVRIAGARPSDKILDVATGTGKQAFAFARKGYQVVGIDFSKDMLRIAIKHNKYKNLILKEADARTVPFNENEFDVSCISFALHDMPADTREKVLQEMIRVTKLNGTILIVDYSLPENRIGKYLIFHFVKTYESVYYAQFIKSDLKFLLTELGIKVVAEFSVLTGGGRIYKTVNLKFPDRSIRV